MFSIIVVKDFTYISVIGVIMHTEMIIRITKYYRILHKLKSLGLERVFASNLADAAGVSPAVVRKDFSLLSLIGQKRGGYDINVLITHLDRILGKDQAQRAAVIGCGGVGGALLRYNGFTADGIQIVAGFDTNVRICDDKDCPVPVYPMSDLEEVIEREQIRVAILTVNEQAAAEVFQRLLEAGIKGFLNFTPVGLRAPRDLVHSPGETLPSVVVHNVNIALELEQIFYEMNLLSAQRT